MKAPPPLPADILGRVRRVGRYHGTCVTAVAGLFAVASLFMRDWLGATVGLMVAGGGALEMRGASLLGSDARVGFRFMIVSQIWVLVSILGYIVWRLGHPDPLMLDLLRTGLREEQRQQLRDVGVSEIEFLRIVLRFFYFVLGFVCTLYQGGMAFFYVRQRAAVSRTVAGQS